MLKSPTLLFALTSLAVSAHAADPFAPSRDYNAVIFGKLTSQGGDSEGRLAVGGDFDAQSSYGVADRVSDDLSKYSLVVGGNLSTVSNWQVFGGKAAIGGTVSGAGVSFELSGAGIDHTRPVDFAGLKGYYSGLAGTLSGLSNTGVFLDDTYSTITLTGLSSSLNVFDLTPAQAARWTAVSTHDIVAPVGSTVVVNIPGLTAGMSNGMALSGGVDQTGVIFNFYQAKNLSISSMGVLGSVLAPSADLQLSGGNINGFSILDSATQKNGGEFHWYPSTAVTPVPEPTTMAVLGLGALGMLRRRKR